MAKIPPDEIQRKAFSDYTEKQIKNKLIIEYKKAQDDLLQQISKIFRQVAADGRWTWPEMNQFNRAQKLFKNIEKRLIQLGQTEEKTLKVLLNELYNEEYSRKLIQSYYEEQGLSWKQIQQKYNLCDYEKSYYQLLVNDKILQGVDFQLIPHATVEKIITAAWSGESFSSRIWKEKDTLIRTLKSELTQSMIQGESMQKAAKRLQTKMGNSAYNCTRLARTEIMRASNEAHIAAYEEDGIEQVQWWAAEDERTCPVCGSRHTQTYDMKDKPIMPAHPNCRCTWIAVIRKRFKNNNGSNAN